MADLSAFPITTRWPAEHPDRLQLYSLPTPNGVKVSIMLEEIGLPYEPHLVDFGKNEQQTPEFLSLNPNGKIPAIIDPHGPNGAPLGLFESGAILLYLADKTGKLVPADAARRYETIQWVFFQMAFIGPMFGQVGYFHKFAGREIADKRPLERYRDESKRLLAVLETRLAGRQWIMGDDYTIADISMLGWVRNLIGFYGARRPRRVRCLAAHPGLAAARPCATCGAARIGDPEAGVRWGSLGGSVEHVAQAHAGAGEAAVALAEAGIRHVRHGAVKPPALRQSKPDRCRLAEIQCAAEGAAVAVMRAVMQRAAERQLERHALGQRDVPSEARIELAGVAVDVDRCTNVNAGPQDDIGQPAAVGEGVPPEKHLDADILTALLGPRRLNVVCEEPDAELVDERSLAGLLLCLGRRTGRNKERGQKKDGERTTRARNLQIDRHEDATHCDAGAATYTAPALLSLLRSILARRHAW